MRITREQQQKLDSLICERLSSQEEHLRSVGTFWNSRNDNIVHTIQNEAYTEDEEGTTAYYVVKHPDTNNILLFFSLKCGMLYDEFINDQNVALYKRLVLFIEELSSHDGLTEDEQKIVTKLKEQLRSHKGLAKADLDSIPVKDNKLIEDLAREINDSMTHVGKTFSGIELVHFCANEGASKDWKDLGIEHKLGVVVFWQFIVPTVLQCRDLVGCQYLFLFAADNTEDEELVSYYRGLNFVDSTERATVKPLYDLTCKFMYQEISALSDLREKFFEDFNPDADAV